jgi:arylsulfatase A-like enzyme
VRLAPLHVFALGALSVLPALACSRGGDGPTPTSNAAVSLAASGAPGAGDKTAARASATVIDFVSGFDGCTLSHRGVLLDLGDATMRPRMSGTKLQAPDVEVREHEGASWASMHERSLELSFVSPVESKPEGGVVVEARVRGGAARSASVYLNGKPIGVMPLVKGEAKVVSVHAANASIARGANELLVRLVGGAKATRDNLAEIDWIRVGPSDGDAPYSAPTRNDALTTVTIGGVARRGVSLRAAGSVRCGAFVPNGAMLEGQIGVSGGEAEAEVRVLVDRAEPRVVGSFRLGGEGAPPWQPISLPLGDVGTLAAVELVAKTSTKGARIVFAEPRVVAVHAAETLKAPEARGVIMVVLGSMAPKSLSPYGGTTATTELAQLATAGTVFESHRASTSFASGALASMLTGLPPRVHGVSEPEAVLGTTGVTIAEAARQAGVVTAMFTANPTTGSAYGFTRGWETFAARSPVDEAPATAVFEDVEHWLDGHKDDRFLVVVHARGGHPPWDVVTGDEKDLAPAGYTGSLDAKHAGEMLAKVRRSGASKLFTDADRERAFALHAKAVLAHDAALGKLIAHVRSIGREADTTWIVTGDVGIDTAAHAPFLEEDSLDEGALAVPLIVRAPGAPIRARVSSPTSSVDLARTVLEALALSPPPQLRGESLWTLAQRGPQGPERPRIATTTSRFSARWSGFVLSGTRDREAKLCNLSLEADCVSDVRATHPLAAEMLHALVFEELSRAAPSPVPASTTGAGGGAGTVGGPGAVATPPDASGEARRAYALPVHPKAPDAATAAALRAWGVGGGSK